MKTPLFNQHISLHAKMAPFGGWICRSSTKAFWPSIIIPGQPCTIFDICHMGEFLVTGKTAEADLNVF
jgi:aminomethyltransferase